MINSKLNKIISDLNQVRGLTVIDVLKEEHKDMIRSVEERNNFGVIEAIKRQHTLLVSHDSTFRDPAGEIVSQINKQTFFPTVPFPELNVHANNIVSSSPSEKVHKKLVDKMNLNLKSEDATLLLGFDI